MRVALVKGPTKVVHNTNIVVSGAAYITGKRPRRGGDSKDRKQKHNKIRMDAALHNLGQVEDRKTLAKAATLVLSDDILVLLLNLLELKVKVLDCPILGL